MIRMRNIIIVVAAVAVLFALGSCKKQGDASGKSGSYTFTLAHNHTEKGLYHLGALKFKELIEERSQGRISIVIYPNGQLGADKEIQEGVQIGTIDMGVSSSPVASIDDYMKLLDAPYLFINREHISDVLDGEIGARIAKPLEEKGIQHLAYWENGFRQITNNKKPIVVPADLAGIKLRTPESAIRLTTFKAFGANPVSMSFGEVFGALQQGVIDGQENPLAVISQGSLFEVQKYLSVSNHVYSPAHLLMSKKVFDTLSPELQTIVKQAAVDAAKYTREIGAAGDSELAATMKEKGMQVNDVNVAAFVAAGKAVWPDVIQAISFSDAQAIMDEIARAGEKYIK